MSEKRDRKDDQQGKRNHGKDAMNNQGSGQGAQDLYPPNGKGGVGRGGHMPDGSFKQFPTTYQNYPIQNGMYPAPQQGMPTQQFPYSPQYGFPFQQQGQYPQYQQYRTPGPPYSVIHRVRSTPPTSQHQTVFLPSKSNFTPMKKMEAGEPEPVEGGKKKLDPKASAFVPSGLPSGKQWTAQPIPTQSPVQNPLLQYHPSADADNPPQVVKPAAEMKPEEPTKNESVPEIEDNPVEEDAIEEPQKNEESSEAPLEENPVQKIEEEKPNENMEGEMQEQESKPIELQDDESTEEAMKEDAPQEIFDAEPDTEENSNKMDTAEPMELEDEETSDPNDEDRDSRETENVVGDLSANDVDEKPESILVSEEAVKLEEEEFNEAPSSPVEEEAEKPEEPEETVKVEEESEEVETLELDSSESPEPDQPPTSPKSQTLQEEPKAFSGAGMYVPPHKKRDIKGEMPPPESDEEEEEIEKEKRDRMKTIKEYESELKSDPLIKDFVKGIMIDSTAEEGSEGSDYDEGYSTGSEEEDQEMDMVDQFEEEQSKKRYTHDEIRGLRPSQEVLEREKPQGISRINLGPTGRGGKRMHQGPRRGRVANKPRRAHSAHKMTIEQAGLKRADDRWTRQKSLELETSELEQMIRMSREVLNKLTLEKFEKLSEDLLSLVDTLGKMIAVINLIFLKALAEPNFSTMYADLCEKLSKRLPVFTEETEDGQEPRNISFKRVLLNKCQEEFEKLEKKEVHDRLNFFNRRTSSSEKTATDQEEESDEELGEDELFKSANLRAVQKVIDKMLGENIKRKKHRRIKLELKHGERESRSKRITVEREEYEIRLRRKMLGNIRFIGELFKKKLLVVRIVHICIQRLLREINQPIWEESEALCKLLTTVGEQLEKQDGKFVDAYMERLAQLSKNEILPRRIRFMIMDVLDLRDVGWVPRRKIHQAKKISEIRTDVERERHSGGRSKAESVRIKAHMDEQKMVRVKKRHAQNKRREGDGGAINLKPQSTLGTKS